MKRNCLILLVIFLVLFFINNVFLYSKNQIDLKKIVDWGTGYYYDVFIQGNYAYCAAKTAGIDIIDISDPSNPKKISNFDTPGNAYGLFISGEYAYVADYYGGLQIIDISNSVSPSLAGSYYDSGSFLDVFVKGNYAYTVEGMSLKIIDISNPSSPSLVGSLGSLGVLINIHVKDDYAYLIDYPNGLKIVNISDPASPSLTGSYDSSGFASGIYISGDYAYLADTINGLKIIDISTPSSPSLEGSFDTSNAERVQVRGDYAYVADNKGGLKIIDTTTPSSPTLTGSYDTSGYAKAVFVSENYAYIADESKGLKIVNISTPSSPFLTGSYDESGYSENVYVKDSYAYIANTKEGIKIVDVSNPSSPLLISSFETLNAVDVFVSGELAYVPDGYGGLKIINVSNPSSPYLVATWNDVFGEASGVQVIDNHAYFANGRGGFHIIDVSDPSSPSLKGSYKLISFAEKVFVKDNYAYLVDSVDTLHSGFQIIDISDISSPYLVGKFEGIDFKYSDVYVKGDYAYLAAGYRGLDVVDISNPSSPFIAYNYDTGDKYAEGIDISGNYAYIANGGNGLIVVDISDLESMTGIYSYDTSGYAKKVFVCDNYVYVANGSSGKIYIFEIHKINITSPNGGESLPIRTIQNITWDSSFSDYNVSIEYSTDNGTSWSYITNSTSSDGSYDWLVPETPSSECLIRIKEVSNNLPLDISDNVFTIYVSSPFIETSSITSITSKSAKSGGTVTSDGGASVTARGICWNTIGSPTTSDTCTSNGTGTGGFTSSLSGLTPDTTYYVRAYATNSIGTSYGQQENFTTIPINNIEIVQPEHNSVVRGIVKIKANASMKEEIVKFYIDNEFLGDGKLLSQDNITSASKIENIFDINDSSYLFIDEQFNLRKITLDGGIKDVFEFKVKVDDININKAGDIFLHFRNGISLENKGFYQWIKINTYSSQVTGVLEPQFNGTLKTQNLDYIKNIYQNRLKQNQRIDKIFKISEKEYIFARFNTLSKNTALVKVNKHELEKEFNIIAFVGETPVKIIKNTLLTPSFPIKINYLVNNYYSSSNNYLYTIDWNTVNYTRGAHTIKVSAEDEYGRIVSDEINVTIRNLIIKLNAVRKSDKAFTFEIHAAELNIEIQNPGNIEVAEFIIHRKADNGNFEQIAVIEPSELNDNKYTYYDKNLNPDISYTYKITAHNSSRETISESEEKTI